MNRQNQADYLGARIRTARVAAGLTQKHLSEKADVPVRSISDIERGHESYYAESYLKRLCDALGIEMVWQQ